MAYCGRCGRGQTERMSPRLRQGWMSILGPDKCPAFLEGRVETLGMFGGFYKAEKT